MPIRFQLKETCSLKILKTVSRNISLLILLSSKNVTYIFPDDLAHHSKHKVNFETMMPSRDIEEER